MIFKILLCAGIVAFFVATLAFFVVGWSKKEVDIVVAGTISVIILFIMYFIAIQSIHQILYGSYIT